jgi:hypothetical protein
MMTNHMNMGVHTAQKFFINYTSEDTQQNNELINHCHKHLQNQ